MDNLTHTLIGALIAETATRVVPSVRSALPDATRRNLYLALMVVGSNLPDLDFVYAGITDGKLGYLLHHRGHTHTVVGAVVLAGLMLAACLAWLRRRRTAFTPSDRNSLACMALLAPLLHVAMDASNSYGVHPFWPVNNAWMYGDAIFIVEPLFWAAAAAPLLFLLHKRAARVLMGLILCAGITLSFGTGLVPRALVSALALLTGALLFVGWRCSGRTVAMTGLAACLGIIGIFVQASHMVYQRTGALAAAQFPDAVLLDRVLSPMPVNPVCWETILVQLDQDKYTLRRAMFSLAPGWLPADRCPRLGLINQTTAVLTPVMAANSSALQWYGEITMSRNELRSLAMENCEAAAFARYARAPWIMRRPSGWFIGDLRYDREAFLSFAELELSTAPQQCPRNVPPWTPPRADLVEPARG